MAEKRKLKKKGQDIPVQVAAQPTKVEFKVANYLKSNVSTKRTKFLNHQVSYFNANKAVDVLLDSPWATGENALFTDRASVVEYCNTLLQHKFFHRAKKIAVTEKDLSPKELKKKQEKEKEKEKERKKELKKKEESEDSKKEEDKTQDEAEKTEEKAEEKEKPKKKKTKIKLDMHLSQVFVDGNEAYVWMYDPIPFWYYIVGALLLFSAVAVCLFPLWPPVVRKGVYYLSIAAAGFLAVILGLAVVRFIIFAFIWMLSLSRHHFWILPNLTEDVGFFASFWPLYHYEYKGALSSGDAKKKSKKKKKNDDEEKDDKEEKKTTEQEDGDTQSAHDTDKLETDVDNEKTQAKGSTVEETDSENSNSNLQTFEMLNKEELSSDDVKRDSS